MSTLSGVCYLVCKKRKYSALHFRLTTRQPSLDSDEVAVRLDVTLPVGLFTRPALQAAVTVPNGVVPGPTIDSTVVDNIREIVSQQTGANLEIMVTQAGNPELERWKQATADVCGLGPETMERIADAARSAVNGACSDGK